LKSKNFTKIICNDEDGCDLVIPEYDSNIKEDLPLGEGCANVCEVFASAPSDKAVSVRI